MENGFLVGKKSGKTKLPLGAKEQKGGKLPSHVWVDNSVKKGRKKFAHKKKQEVFRGEKKKKNWEEVFDAKGGKKEGGVRVKNRKKELGKVGGRGAPDERQKRERSPPPSRGEVR